MRTFDLDQSISLISQVVREDGYSHVAISPEGGSGCRYIAFDGYFLNAVCIVGRLFDRLGILAAAVHNFEEQSQESACVTDSGLWDRAEEMGVSFTKEARQFLRDVQDKQDSGYQWGEALARTVESLHGQRILDAKAKVDDLVAEQTYALGRLPQPPAEH